MRISKEEKAEGQSTGNPYQGLMKVKGTIGGKNYEGMAWAELQPEGHL